MHFISFLSSPSVHQEATSRSVKLTCPLDQLMPPAALATAEALGLRPVGWIFTDLTADGADGSVKHYRGDMVCRAVVVYVGSLCW